MWKKKKNQKKKIMKFYEVITNAYANEIITQNDLPDYAHCGPS
jgi:hypothetical protein